MKKIIFIILVITLFISCKKICNDVNGLLTPEELSWLSYSGGETLIFKSNNNQVDTFKVSDKIEYNTPVSNGTSGSCNAKQQSIEYSIECFLHLELDMGLETWHKNEWSPAGKAYIITGQSVFNFLDYSPQNNILINGNAYNDVYIMNVDTSSLASKRIWRIYYTKQNGILRFDLTHGEQWEKIN